MHVIRMAAVVLIWVAAGPTAASAQSPAGGMTNMLVRNGALAKALATTLGDKPVALMRGHGNVVVGPNVKRATIRAVYTEVNARLQTIALGLGGPINYVSAEEGALRDKNPGEEGRAWDGWKEKAMRK